MDETHPTGDPATAAVRMIRVLDGLRDDAELVDAAGHAAAHLGCSPLSTLLDVIGDRLHERLDQLDELHRAATGETEPAEAED